jgi:hypothetical protein
MSDIKKLMDLINSAKVKYNLIFCNCITSARAFQNYACGSYTELDVIKKIMPGVKSQKDVLTQLQEKVNSSFYH